MSLNFPLYDNFLDSWVTWLTQSSRLPGFDGPPSRNIDNDPLTVDLLPVGVFVGSCLRRCAVDREERKKERERYEAMADRLLIQLTKQWRFLFFVLTYLCPTWPQEKEKERERERERGERAEEGPGQVMFTRSLAHSSLSHSKTYHHLPKTLTTINTIIRLVCLGRLGGTASLSGMDSCALFRIWSSRTKRNFFSLNLPKQPTYPTTNLPHTHKKETNIDIPFR